MTKLSEQASLLIAEESLLVAEQLAAANFAKHPDKLPTDQMLDITEPHGLSGNPDEVEQVGCLCCVLDLAANIAALQADTLHELAEMVRKDMSERKGGGVTVQ
jgi:hypothetical protein